MAAQLQQGDEGKERGISWSLAVSACTRLTARESAHLHAIQIKDIIKDFAHHRVRAFERIVLEVNSWLLEAARGIAVLESQRSDVEWNSDLIELGESAEPDLARKIALCLPRGRYSASDGVYCRVKPAPSLWLHSSS